MILIIFLWLPVVILSIVFIRMIYKQISDKVKYEKGQMNEYEIQKYEQKKAAKTIVKTMIVGSTSDSRKKFSSAATRGIVGGALLGPVGLVGGALSGKNKVTNTTTFLIEFADGHRETRTVDTNSYAFNNLCKYLDM